MNLAKAWTKTIFAKAPPALSADLLLVEKVQAGDMAAFDQLLRKHRERVYSLLYNLTGNREEAYDLCQETFIRAFRCIHRFKQTASFQTWVCRIGVNTALTYLKRERRRRFFSLDEIDTELAPEEVLSHLSIDPDADQAIFLQELKEKLNQALQVLSSKHRAVVVMSEIEGMDHAAIAEIMGCSEGTVRSRLHYAKQQLKQFLKSYLPKK